MPPPNFQNSNRFPVFLLPIPILRQVKALGRRQKAGLAAVLALGILTMTVSTGRFITMMYTDNYISLCKHQSLATQRPRCLVKADSPLYDRHLGDHRILGVHHGR